METTVQNKQPLLVWDIFIRIFHWALVACIGFAWWTGEQGGDWMEWHKRCGYGVLGLVLFRMMWGMAGSFYARFRQFVRSPQNTLIYFRQLIKRQEPEYAGHNPLGGWAVILLLLLCAVQAGSGLFANDDVFTEGPLAHLVNYDLSIEITRWHKWLFNVLLAVIGVHVAGVVYHQLFRGERLLQAMFTGTKKVMAIVDAAPAGASVSQRVGLGLILVLVAGLLVWGLISL